MQRILLSLNAPNTMQIPSSFVQLLDERITFCQAQLQALKLIADSASKDLSVSLFETSLSNFTALRRMSGVVKNTSNPNTRLRFKEAAKAIVAEMISIACDQMQAVNLIDVRHKSLNLLDGLEKIYKEIEAI